MPELLEVKNLSVTYASPQGDVQAVRGVSFSLHPGEVLAVVGESGCGKSAMCRAILHLLPASASVSGEILVRGTDIRPYGAREMRRLRGSVFSMVFQDPMTALNPTMTVGAQIAEAVRFHDRRLSREAVQARVGELMNLVGIDRAAERSRVRRDRKDAALSFSHSVSASKSRSRPDPARNRAKSSAVNPKRGLARQASKGMSCLGLETVCKRLCST